MNALDASTIVVALVVFCAALYASKRAAFAPGAWRLVLPLAAGLNASARIGLVVAVDAFPDPLPWFTVLGFVMVLGNALFVAALLMLPCGRTEGAHR